MLRRYSQREPAEPPSRPSPEPADPRAPGNRALAHMLSREVGWKGAGKANAGERESSGLRRIPIEGLKGAPSRAIVVLPQTLANPKSIDVLLHLHGFTPGYAGSKPDDEGVYRIEAQMAAADRDLMAILPQGSANSDFNAGDASSKGFDADRFIAAVFARLTQEGVFGDGDPPSPGRVIMSSHSGGDQPLSEMLKGTAGRAPAKLAGLFLFDSMIATAFSGAVGDYTDQRIVQELDHLRLMRFSPADPAVIEQEMLEWLQENGFRLQVYYRKGGAYDAAGRAIAGRLALRFAAAIKELGPPGSPVHEAMKDHFQVHEVTDTTRIQHMDMLAGDDHLQHAIEGLPTDVAAHPRTGQPLEADPIDTPQLMRLASRAGNHAVARMLARQPTAKVAAPETVTVTVRWNQTQPPQKYLKDAFKGHPVDWKADVYVDNVKKGSGDGSLDVSLVKGAKHAIKVVPTPAAKTDDFYDPGTLKITAETGTVDVPLGYNRENQYFTDESWEHEGIDPAKARKVINDPPLLGHKVTFNAEAKKTVEKTNDEFKKLTPDEQKEISASIVHIGGYNRRTTSEGTFSNHSTGCAVDINTNIATAQNDHWKDYKDAMKNRMELFAHVVQRESSFKSFDGWSEKDAHRWLEASRLFNFHFPRFLGELLDDAAGGGDAAAIAQWGEALDWLGGTEAVGKAMVAAQDPAKLKKAAAAAKKAKKPDTAKWLERVAADWTAVRAWIEGVVMYDTEHWAYVSDHESRVAAGKEKRKPIGELHGMIPLHPKLVDTLIAGGWTWLIDQQHAKDFMHFEDRTAFEAIKKKK